MKAATVDPAPGGSGPLMATHLPPADCAAPASMAMPVPMPVTIIDMTSQTRATVAIRDIMPGVQADLDALGRVIRLRVQQVPPDLLPTA
ncbi:hypothetical protein HLH34_15110 [Gluconacetobacter azotocaptans]|uniref:Uncharacterized protein n=1 Tax=Gluconacetobacter azotocaptans TaxID=142834 RepID=A0A7W4JUR2_9PROT|nr:hypothetical protein [Gluconacetobacter azotocaptans]MBB2191275.1 hypothetical protein [Gluconacetobacter azotocaptans]MBM9402060.1 hypothetical protein [Gluconacetobacter azotocaptans]GBQ33849.1 hypothetical protein AA13594_2731 [Gluconacetobacter azotocaptans DSM 13594]